MAEDKENPIKRRGGHAPNTHQEIEVADNEILDFIANVQAFWSRYGQEVTIIFCIVAFTFAGYRFFTMYQANSHNAAWWQLASSTSPQSFEAVAGEHSGNTAVRALALLHAGDLYLSQAINPESTALDIGDGAPVAAKVTDSETSLASAIAQYQTILDEQHLPIYQVNALLGLATVAEAQSDFEAAAARYNDAEKLAEANNFTHLAEQAVSRRELLDELKKPVVFAPSAEVDVSEVLGSEDIDDVFDASNLIDSSIIDNMGIVNTPAETVTESVTTEVEVEAAPETESESESEEASETPSP